MDYMYLRPTSHLEDHQFAWILWYLWREQNNKVFSNIDLGPKDTPNLVESESLLWVEAHASLTKRITQSRKMEMTSLPSTPGSWFLQMDHRKIKIISRNMVGILHYKASMD